VVQLGTSTDTYDADGRVLSSNPVEISESQFENALQSFIGEIEQIPPPYSAVKIKGRKAYEMAREGEEIDLQPRKITVYSLELLEWAPPEAVIDVYCSSGTYIRSLANDLGKMLGCGAHLVGLRRTKSGRFTLRDAAPLRKLREAFEDGSWYQFLIPAAEALSDWPSVDLTVEDVDSLRHGGRIPGTAGIGKMARGISEQGELVALLEFDPASKEWQPKKVFFQ
jgi:tRNA pseudouridine55 synthase